MNHVIRIALALVSLSAMSMSCFAAEFYAIVDNFDRRPLNAFMDVAVDGASGGNAPPEVSFRIFDVQGAQLAEFWATTTDGFASTFSFGNLFELANGQPLLIRASTPAISPDQGAALHLELRGANLAVGVLQKLDVDGSRFGAGHVFSVPLGSFRKASLLIANVSGTDVGVESFIGVRNAPGSGTVLNARLASHGVHRVDLTQSEAFTNYIVQSTDLVIVQVVIDDGKYVQAYMLPPSS